MRGINRRSLLGSVTATAIIRPSKARLLRTNGGSFYNDGKANAPSGTPQYYGLFTDSTGTAGGIPNGNPNAPYAHRPPWNVAGADYTVGIDRSLYPTNANLKNPTGAPLTSGLNTALFNLGCRLSGTTITSSSANGGDNTTIDGWDFSLGGYLLQIDSSGVTVSNNNFLNTNGTATVVGCSGNVGNFTFTKNIVDQNKVAGTTAGACAFDSSSSGGTILVNYNWIKNAWAEAFTFGFDADNVSLDCQFNLIENAGWGFDPTSGSIHGDWVQMGVISPGTTFVTSIIYRFNTWLQYAPFGTVGVAGGARTQGITWAPIGLMGQQINEYNTAIGTSGALVSFYTSTNDANVRDYQSFSNNYLDLSCVNPGAAWLSNFSSGSTYNNTPVITGNTDMVSGGTLVINQGYPYH